MRPCAILLSILVALTGALAWAALDVTPAAAQIVIPDDDEDQDTRRDKKDRGKKDRDRDKKQRDASEPSCRQGQEVNADTDGHCCWPGQGWNGERCVGTPTRCPDDWRVDTATEACMPASCPRGAVMVDEENCCWPGQAWSSSRDQCVGRPEHCPSGTVADGETCLPDMDDDGVTDSEDLCPAVAESLDGIEDTDGCPEGPPTEVASEVPPLEDHPYAPGEDGTIGTMGIVGWVVAPVGAVIMGTGLGLHFLAESRRDEVREASIVVDGDGNEVREGITQREALDAESEANTIDTVGVVLIGVGGAAILVGLTLAVLDATSEPDSISVAPAVLPDGGGALVLGGRF